MNRKPVFDEMREILGRPFTVDEVKRLDAAFELGLGLTAALAQPAAPVDMILVEQLKIDEGCRLKAYKDTEGIWTIGYGHAHVQPGSVWTQEQAERQLKQDVLEHNNRLAAKIPWINQLDPVRRRVLQNMHFNMGWDDVRTPQKEGLSGFVNTLEMVRTGRYADAAANMLKSKWAKQVKGRATRLSEQMRTGK